MKRFVKSVLPASTWRALRSLKRVSLRTTRRSIEALGYNVARKSDFYSPLPSESGLVRTVSRWNRPSALAGVSYDIDRYKHRLRELTLRYWDEFEALPPYTETAMAGFGPGYTEFDALVLYATIRDLKPARYFEVGSGVSTFYCSVAASRNADEGRPVQIRCIEPSPLEQLHMLPGVEILSRQVQDLSPEMFLELHDGDVLFIDSTHVLRIDGDVSFLVLEVLPRLRKGVAIHVHDVPFPYNIPYPAEHWVLGKTHRAPDWPMYWNEAMVLQAFLAFNNAFEIEISAPLIRYHDEAFLSATVPLYQSVAEEPNTLSSIWLRKIA